MATYVSLMRFTEQGAKNIGDTRRRAGAFREAAQKAGVTVRDIYWTLGAYDGLLVLEAPDEESITSVMAGLGALGNVRTQTMRAFDESEIGGILERARTGGGQAAGGGTERSGAAGGPSNRGRRGK
jgi:uncharacterized protein with GYD domain